MIICGEATSDCVRAGVIEGLSSGSHVTLVEECTPDRAQLTRKINLFAMRHTYADVMQVDEVVSELLFLTT